MTLVSRVWMRFEMKGLFETWSLGTDQVGGN